MDNSKKNSSIYKQKAFSLLEIMLALAISAGILQYILLGRKS